MRRVEGGLEGRRDEGANFVSAAAAAGLGGKGVVTRNDNLVRGRSEAERAFDRLMIGCGLVLISVVFMVLVGALAGGYALYLVVAGGARGAVPEGVLLVKYVNESYAGQEL